MQSQDKELRTGQSKMRKDMIDEMIKGRAKQLTTRQGMEGSEGMGRAGQGKAAVTVKVR